MFITKVNQTYHKLILKSLSPPNTDGILKTSFYTDSELLSVVTDRLVSVWLMTINNILSSMNQTSDWENWPFYQKETLKEKLKNNWKEKLRNLEVLKREKFLLPERNKLKVMLKKLNKNILRNLFDLQYLNLFNQQYLLFQDIYKM